ncbi:MAG TPA: hypothetical protein VNX68_17890 [Nitrosopumilaceae archaeon]|jgi:hypothetical protein|nr:hypothetical protein [Nitrosopumilaceae archaeon]
MPSSLTVTAKYGPGLTATATVISNVLSFAIDTVNKILTVVSANNTQQFDLSATTTYTLTFSAGNYTLTIT